MNNYLRLEIEQLEAFEDRLGVNIKNVSAFIKGNGYIYINGELHLHKEMRLKQDIQLIISAYDSSGHILKSTSTFIDSNSFFGFEVFSDNIIHYSGSVSRLRIYPKLG